MKIALLMSGGLRNFEDTYSSFKYHLFDKLDIDIFFYGLENKEGKDKNEKKFKKLFNPVSFVINDKEYYEKLNVKSNYNKNSYYMFHNMEKVYQLFEKSVDVNEYDIVIRSRPDIFWFRTITNDEFILSKKYIITPLDWCFNSINDFAICDMFAIGSIHNMEKYYKVIDSIDDYLTKYTWHPESILGYHIIKNNIQNKMIDRHFIFEYPNETQYKYIPKDYHFVQEFDNNFDRKKFD